MLGFFKLARAKNGQDDPSTSVSPVAGVGTAGVVLKSAGPGRLYRLTVENKAATAYWVMIFDSASAPVNGNTPIARRKLAVSGVVDIDYSEYGLACPTAGIAWALSSTDNTLTLAVANDAHYQAQFK